MPMIAPVDMEAVAKSVGAAAALEVDDGERDCEGVKEATIDPMV